MVYLREFLRGGRDLAEDKRTRKKLRLDAPTRQLAGRIWRDYVRHHKVAILLAIVCMVIVAASAGGQARLIEPALDKVLVTGDERLVWIIPLAFLAISIIKGFGSYGQTVLMNRVGLRVVTTLQSEMFDRIVRADLAYLHGDATGKLISRFTNDVNFLREAVIKTVTGSVRDLLTVVVLVGVMFYTHWVLATMAFIVFPVSVFPVIYLGRRLRRVSAETQAELGVLTALLDDVFKGVRQVKAYGMENHEQRRADGMFESIFRFILKAARVRARSYPIMETLGGLAIAGVLFYGGYQVLHGETTVGKLIAFLTALVMAFQPMRSLASLNASLQEGLAAAQRIFTMIDYRPAIVDSPDSGPLKIEEGAIRYDDVTFSYGDGIPALRGVTIEARPGQKIALVGPSGAGKSTLLHIAGLLESADAGDIRICGKDCAGIGDNARTLVRRHHLGFVYQYHHLLPEFTALENIVIPQIIRGFKRREARARAAEILEWLGIAERAKHRPARLSGGEQQRVAIGRAIATSPDMLLADEPTGNLDPQTADGVFDVLLKLARGANLAAVIATHNPDLAGRMDRVVRLEDGHLIEA